jgi:hypothetical protein
MSLDLTRRPTLPAVGRLTEQPTASTAITETRRIPWLTVGLLAATMACADAFLMQALQGATGSIERSQQPFDSWLRHSAMLLPLFVLAVLGVLKLAHRRYGPSLREPRPVLTAAALTAAAGTLIGIGAITANAAYNYHLQSDQLKLAHNVHSTAITGETSHDHATLGGCSGACLQQHQTLDAHVKGVKLTSGLLLATNVVLVGWVVALRGGQLDGAVRRRPQ